MPSNNKKKYKGRGLLPLLGVLSTTALLSACTGIGTIPDLIHKPVVDNDPIDILPVARFTTPIDVDDMAQCIGEGWARLSVIGEGHVTLHPGLRGLIVDVKAASDPLARSYVEVYVLRGVTRVDYYIRSFVSDPIENLRLRALQSCLSSNGP